MLPLLFSFVLAQAETIGSAQLGLSYNRIGLGLVAQHGVHIPKWEKEGNVLFQGTGIQAVGEINTSPAFIKPGVRFTIIPIAVLKLQAYAFADYYYGNFQTIIVYDDLDVNYGTNSDMKSYTENTDRQYSGGGWHGGGKLVLQAKVKDIIFMNSTDYSHNYIATPEGETSPATFDRLNEVMIALEGDQLLTNDTLLLYHMEGENEKFLRAGLLNTYRQTFKADDRLYRTGVIGMANTGGKGMHIFMVQPYVIDRTYGQSWTEPYIAYAYKYVY